MTDPRSPGGRKRRSIAVLLALGLPLTAATTLALPSASASASASAADDSPASNTGRSEVQAFDVAAKTGQRVEILDRREEAAETFANPDGTTTRRQYVAPKWSRYEGVWKEADATVVRRSDGTVGPASPVFGIAFSGGGTSPLVTMAKDGKKLSLSWPSELPQPLLEGNTALYKSVLPDVDLKVTAEVDGFAEHLIVNTPQAAANPAVKSIKLGVSTSGVTLTDDASDNLIAKDPEGNVIFSAPRPMMWEQAAAGSKSAAVTGARLSAENDGDKLQSAPVGAGISGNTLTLTPDPTLLATADQFPLVVDPVFTGGKREKWAVVYSKYPTEAYPNGSGWHSDTPSDEPRVGYNGTGATRSFFAMNTDGLAGADILDATFSVVETHSWGCDKSLAGPTELWSTGGIGTTPTWNDQPSWADKLVSDSYAHGNPTYCPGNEPHDYASTALTSYVRKAADSGWGTLVFGLRAPSSYEDNVNSFKRFTNSPALEVKYNFKPTVDDHDAYEGTYAPGGDGNKQVPCGGAIGNSGLAVTAKLTDKDGGQVTAEVVVTNSTGGTVSFPKSTDTVSSGQTAQVTVPKKVLTGTSYSWKLRAKDDEDTYSAYTAACAFSIDAQGPEKAVTVTNTDGTPADEQIPPDGQTPGRFDIYPARKPVTLNLSNPANDLAGFCWRADFILSASSTRCAYGTWVNVGPDHHTATITVTPAGYPLSTLHVVAYDTAGNHSPLDSMADAVVLHTSPADFVYAPDQIPGTGPATHQDLPGDLNGDGYVDMVATDADGKLRLYAGDGTGKVATAQTIGTTGWTDALIAHRGDLTGFTQRGGIPDGYEDYVVRLADNKLYVYGGDGRGEPNYYTRHELPHPQSLDYAPDWGRIRQLTLPGDIDKNTTEGHADGNDLITIECIDDIDDGKEECNNAALYLYSGNTYLGAQNPDDPFDFDLNHRVTLGTSGWKDLTILAVGDQNGDKVQDLLVRSPSTGVLYLYPGQLTNGVFSLGTRSVYGTAGWQNRPHLASPGNVQGTVVTGTFEDPDAGIHVTYRQFQPTPGETYGDLWATTPADPTATVNYVDDTGAAKSTTCPSGCLLFYPGGPGTHRSPRLVGASGWDTIITNIF
ncbi:hypothetical protein ABZ479_38240 [Streptomyces sp. NPDC005722]